MQTIFRVDPQLPVVRTSEAKSLSGALLERILKVGVSIVRIDPFRIAETSLDVKMFPDSVIYIEVYPLCAFI